MAWKWFLHLPLLFLNAHLIYDQRFVSVIHAILHESYMHGKSLFTQLFLGFCPPPPNLCIILHKQVFGNHECHALVPPITNAHLLWIHSILLHMGNPPCMECMLLCMSSYSILTICLPHVWHRSLLCFQYFSCHSDLLFLFFLPHGHQEIAHTLSTPKLGPHMNHSSALMSMGFCANPSNS